MLSIDDIFLFAHITSVIFWIGAGVTVLLLSFRALESKNPDRIIEATAFGEWLSKRVFMPSALSTLLFGVLLVAFGRPTFSQFWIIFGFLGIIVTAIIGGAFVGKSSKQLVDTIKSKKLSEKKLFSLFSRVVFYSSIDVAILIIVVFDMVLKPKVTDISFYTISIIFFLLVLFWSQKKLGIKVF
jgi:hypothetical protein